MTNYSVGNLAEKYETSNRGPGYISNGSQWGDPGGDSYGSYQLETKLGTMQAYLHGDDKFINSLKQFTINSEAFKAKWKALAEEDPQGFEQSQFDYLAKKPGGYNDAIAYAQKLGWSTDSFAMQSAIFSTVNQSGGWKNGIFNKVDISQLEPVQTQINKLYDARAKYFKNLNIDATVKKNIIKDRTVDERQDALTLAKKFG